MPRGAVAPPLGTLRLPVTTQGLGLTDSARDSSAEAGLLESGEEPVWRRWRLVRCGYGETGLVAGHRKRQAAGLGRPVGSDSGFERWAEEPVFRARWVRLRFFFDPVGNAR